MESPGFDRPAHGVWEMPHRRQARKTDPKERVFWSDTEKQALTRRALELRDERPDLAGLPLLRQAMLALPIVRRRRIVASGQVEWFESGMADAMRARVEANRPSPDDQDWRSRDREFARLEVGLLERMASQQEGQADRLDRLIGEFRAILELHRDWEPKLAEVQMGILDELRRQTELFGRIVSQGSNGPSPKGDKSGPGGQGNLTPSRVLGEFAMPRPGNGMGQRRSQARGPRIGATSRPARRGST